MLVRVILLIVALVAPSAAGATMLWNSGGSGAVGATGPTGATGTAGATGATGPATPPRVLLSDFATCDGSDETTEIQAAITAACGGTLYVPETPVTACTHASTLTGCSGLTIVGSDGIDRSAVAPHRITYTGTGTGWDFSGLQSVVLRGFEVRAGSASFSAGTLLELDGSSYVTLDRMYVIASSGQADAATSKAINANDTVDLDIEHSLFTRFGYHVYGRATSGDFANNVRIHDSVFYRAEACSIQNLGDAITITDSWWQQQGASDTKSNVMCHDAGICMRGFTMTGSMSVDQPNGPTVPVFDVCGAGMSITGNFIAGNTTQDGIRISEASDGSAIYGNWFGFLNRGISLTSTGPDSAGLVTYPNGYTTVTTPFAGTQPDNSLVRIATSGVYVNEPLDYHINVDTDANSGAGAIVFGFNDSGLSATQGYVFTEGYTQFRGGNDLRLFDTDDSNYVQLSVPALAANFTATFPAETGTVCTTGSVCSGYAPELPASCTFGIQTASDSTASCITESSTPEFVARVETAGGTLGNYAVVMANGSNDDEVIEATTAATHILGCSQDGNGAVSTDPIVAAVDGVARCKADTTVVAGSLVKIGATGELAVAGAADTVPAWGRAVTDDDGAGSAYVKLFDTPLGLIDHALDLWPSIPDLTTNTLNAANFSPSQVDITGAGTLRGFNFAPTTTLSATSATLVGFRYAPTVSSSNLDTQYAVKVEGTHTQTALLAGTFAGNSFLFDNAGTFTSATAGVQPRDFLVAVNERPTISNTASSGTATMTQHATVIHNPTITRSNAGTFIVSDDTGVDVKGVYTEGASGVLQVSRRRGFLFREVTNTSSATAIGDNIGVDIEALGAAGATTNIGIRNADTTVNTPTTQTIAADTDTISPTATVVCVNATANRDLSSNPQISDGQQGQILTVINCDSGAETIELNDTNGLNLSAVATLGAGDSVTLIYLTAGGASDWFEIARSNN